MEDDDGKKSRLTRVAVELNGNGQADRKVQKVAKAGTLARKELDDISKQVDALKRQLQKNSEAPQACPQLVSWPTSSLARFRARSKTKRGKCADAKSNLTRRLVGR